MQAVRSEVGPLCITVPKDSSEVDRDRGHCDEVGAIEVVRRVGEVVVSFQQVEGTREGA